MEAVGKWRFEPAVTGDGKPATIATEVEVEFRLESATTLRFEVVMRIELQSRLMQGTLKQSWNFRKH